MSKVSVCLNDFSKSPGLGPGHLDNCRESRLLSVPTNEHVGYFWETHPKGKITTL